MPKFDVVPQNVIFAKWVGYLALIDLLFFPYFQPIIIPYSLPLIMFGFIFLDVKIAKDYYYWLYVLITVGVLVSLSISFLLPPYSKFASYNLKSAFQLLTAFFYFFYYRWLTKKSQLNITPILAFFVAWFVFLGLLFLSDPVETNHLISNIYGRLINSDESVLYDFRFTYIFQDPNTGIYFFLIVLAYLLMAIKNTYLILLLVTIGGLMVLICQSTGGLYSYSLILLVLYLKKIIKSILSVKKIFIVIFAVIVLSWLYSYFIFQTQDNTVIKYSIERLSGSSDRLPEGGGRFHHWSALYKKLIPYPFGRGYTLYDEGRIKPPHSDFFGLLYRYGFIALIACIFFFFSKYRKVAPLLIPVAITFLINSLIDEEKLFALFLSLLAIGITVAPQHEKYDH